MKAVFYFLGMLLIVSSSCKKDKSEGIYYGTASATINGVSWKSTKVRCGANQACFKGKLSIQLLKYNDQGYLRETIGFGKLIAGVGKKEVYPINYQNACNDTLDGTYNTSTDHGDVSLDAYNASPSGGNYINIERYNERTGEISGTFNITYVIFIRQAANSPDTIRITNGKFNTRILD